MTFYGLGDEGQRPSGRGVTERLARQERGAPEIDLTDEAADREDGADPVEERDRDQTDRESVGAFEPAPPAEGTGSGPSSIFDVDERAKQEDLNRTGYEPPMADHRGRRRPVRGAAGRGGRDHPDPGPDRPPTPAEDTAPGLPEPRPAPPPRPKGAGRGPAEESPAAEAPATLPGSLDVAGIRNRFLDIQAGFIDEPRQVVEEAGRVDDLVRQVAGQPPGPARPAGRGRGLDRGPAPGPARLPPVRRPPPGPGQLSESRSASGSRRNTSSSIRPPTRRCARWPARSCPRPGPSWATGPSPSCTAPGWRCTLPSAPPGRGLERCAPPAGP